MLEPQDRTMLLEALKPPTGYALDFAIGTTYTLDLLAMLTAPLGFTLFELRGTPAGELTTADGLILLKTLREYADRMTIFCEAGRVSVPAKHSILLGHLEESIVQVAAPAPNRTFHPKVWVLRFREEDGQLVRYRFLCLSRNLTFDRSWDTVLTLEGPFDSHRKLAHAAIRPMAEFVAALPRMVVGAPMSERMLRHVAQAVEELPRVAFDVPEQFDDFVLHPLGHDGVKRWPIKPADRMLVVSPFVTASALTKLTTGRGRDHVLISRPEELAKLSREQLASFKRVYQLDPGLAPEEGADDTPPAAGAEEQLEGLHAKLFVAERGWEASIYTGSANATNAAFDGGVEFLVELQGKRSKCGIDAILASDKAGTGLLDLMKPFEPGDAVLPDVLDERLDELLNAARAVIARRPWTVTVSRDADVGAYSMMLTADGEPADLPSGVHAACRPLMLPAFGRPLGRLDEPLVFSPVSFEALSAFFAIDLHAEIEGRACGCSFAINARMVGAPSNRKEAITQYLLRDRQQVVRFLLMLLADHPEDVAMPDDGVTHDPIGTGASAASGDGSAGLLESLLRALDRDPSRLDATRQVVTDLMATEEGRAKLPEGFDTVWSPIWAAREALSK